MKNFNEQKFKQHLNSTPWHVSKIFEVEKTKLVSLLIN